MNHPTSTRIRCFSMPAIWRASCAASLHQPNSSRDCRGYDNTQIQQYLLAPHLQFFGNHEMSQPTKLLEPYRLGPITLPNRLVMAPLTRNRATEGLVPNPLAIEYYGQRASAGLLISEASQVSQQGQ